MSNLKCLKCLVTHKLNCLTRRLRRSTLGFSMFRLLDPESCEELGYLRSEAEVSEYNTKTKTLDGFWCLKIICDINQLPEYLTCQFGLHLRSSLLRFHYHFGWLATVERVEHRLCIISLLLSHALIV